MKRIIAISLDYLLNAAKSGTLGIVIALMVCLVRGSRVLVLSDAAFYALIGVVCGTCSKASIEGAFLLFGKRSALAYLLNALIIALVIPALVCGFRQGFDGMPLGIVILIFALAEGGSVLLVRGVIGEASRIEQAIEEKRKSLGED